MCFSNDYKFTTYGVKNVLFALFNVVMCESHGNERSCSRKFVHVFRGRKAGVVNVVSGKGIDIVRVCGNKFLKGFLAANADRPVRDIVFVT